MDPFRVLGLPPSATKDEIKSAFRTQALRHHPDQHVNSPEALRKSSEAIFKQIADAYELLSSNNYQYSNPGSSSRTGRGGGFRRSSTNYNPYSEQYARGNTSYDTYSTRPGYQNFSRRAAAEARSHWRAFTSSGSAAVAASLGGLFLAGIIFLEPVFSSAWETHNKGRLFKHLEEEVRARKRAPVLESPKLDDDDDSSIAMGTVPSVTAAVAAAAPLTTTTAVESLGPPSLEEDSKTERRKK